MNKYLEEEWNEHLRKLAERNEKERQKLFFSEKDTPVDGKIGLDGVDDAR